MSEKDTQDMQDESIETEALPSDDSDSSELSDQLTQRDYDVCVIGAGAAGFMAAWQARSDGATVALLERNERSGKKILISGGGKCNITNTEIALERYHGTHPRFLQDVLRAFDQYDLREWLDSIGLETVEGERYGKVWPKSMMSKSVVAALEHAIDEAGVDLHLSRDVTAVHHDATQERFTIETKQGETYHCRALVFASGGRAAPHLGATDSGLKIVEELGHSLVPQYPALAGLHIADEWIKELQGLTCEDVEITLEINGKALLSVTDNVLFTHYGLTSPGIFRLSREVDPAIEAGKSVRIILNFDAERFTSPEEVAKIVFETLGSNTKKRAGTVVGYLVGYRRLGDVLTKLIDADPEKRVREIQKKQRDKLEELVSRCSLNVTGTQGWARAEVMRGGIDVRGVNPKTMASKKCDGLYICGEMLDIDGDVGGFNFQFAFASGKAAGKAAASFVQSAKA